MKRLTLHLLTLAALGLFIASTAAFIRSFIAEDRLYWHSLKYQPVGHKTEVAHNEFELTTSRGGLRLIHHAAKWMDDLGGEFPDFGPFEWNDRRPEYYPSPLDSLVISDTPRYSGERFGFGYAYHDSPSSRTQAVTVPLIAPMTVAGLVAILGSAPRTEKASSFNAWAMPHLRLRPPGYTRPVPRVRHISLNFVTIVLNSGNPRCAPSPD